MKRRLISRLSPEDLGLLTGLQAELLLVRLRQRKVEMKGWVLWEDLRRVLPRTTTASLKAMLRAQGQEPCDSSATVAAFPHLVAQWHPRNPLSPWETSSRSSQRLWWRCAAGHEWEAKLTRRVRSGSGCRWCNRNNRKGANDNHKCGHSRS